jgi:UDPglucose 6-dehydrogenase
LKEGDAVNDFMKPARVIIGCDDERALTVLRNLYAPFMQTNDRVQVMDPRSAELTKYAANAMLATRISFMNELALLCERVGADVEKVRRGIGSDPRIGPKFLFAGPGYGGSCFPKDIRALVQTAKEAGLELYVTDAAQRANARQKKVLGECLKKQLGGLSGKKVAVWGLAFKPETDDVRESPAVSVIEDLLAGGARVAAFDPAANQTARLLLGDRIEYGADMYDIVQSADALVVVTEWHAFRRPDFPRLKQLMRTPLLIDGRNVWNGEQVREIGFSYYGIGRPAP